VKVANGSAPGGHLIPAASWFNPFATGSFSAFETGVTLMIFIYWGWDTTVSINEETAHSTKTPGRAAIISTVMLLAIYALVILAVESYAGLGSTGIGLANPAHIGDVLSVLGTSIFGTSTFGAVLSHLLLLMVLTSAAASTQTTILPTARTTLGMAAHGAISKSFAKMHPRHRTPTVSTLTMGAVSIVLYAIMNYISAGAVIADSVTALGVAIAFYYGFTGLACVWAFRRTLRESARNLWFRGILPALGALILFAILVWSVREDWGPGSSYTVWKLPFSPHWQVGGVFIILLITLVVGVLLFGLQRVTQKPYFRGETLERYARDPESTELRDSVSV